MTDFEANRENLLTGDLARYRILHIASHGLVDNERPELSSLLVSRFDATGQPREGVVGLPDIFNLQLSAELVVLSACKTGLGTFVRGEGLVGLTPWLHVCRRVPDCRQPVEHQRPVHGAADDPLLSRPASGQTSPGPPPCARRNWTCDANPGTATPFFWAPFQVHGQWAPAKSD
jgi:CHAT domain-containing protein